MNATTTNTYVNFVDTENDNAIVSVSIDSLIYSGTPVDDNGEDMETLDDLLVDYDGDPI